MMTKIQANEERRAIFAHASLAAPFKHGLAAVGIMLSRYHTLRIVAALPRERLRDCGIDPSLSKVSQTSPDEARLMLSLMSMR